MEYLVFASSGVDDTDPSRFAIGGHLELFSKSAGTGGKAEFTNIFDVY
jgi:hypothetical protein